MRRLPLSLVIPLVVPAGALGKVERARRAPAMHVTSTARSHDE
jgi:hypothetical protein